MFKKICSRKYVQENIFKDLKNLEISINKVINYYLFIWKIKV